MSAPFQIYQWIVCNSVIFSLYEPHIIQDFPDIDSGGGFYELEESAMDDSSYGGSQVLNQRLRNMELADRNESRMIFASSLTLPHFVGTNGTACKDEPLDEQWGRLVSTASTLHPGYEPPGMISL